MIKKRQVLTVVSISIISFLIGTMFNMNFLTKANSDGSPWDRVWTAISELQSTVETLEARVEALESQTGLPAPDYDSGWLLADDSWIWINHNLGTVEVFVYLIGKSDSGLISGFGDTKLEWTSLSTTKIQVFGDGYKSKYVRVMMWKISEPPT